MKRRSDWKLHNEGGGSHSIEWVVSDASMWTWLGEHFDYFYERGGASHVRGGFSNSIIMPKNWMI